MQTQQLAWHGAFAPLAVTGVEAKWEIVGPWLQLRWRVEGAQKLVLPHFAGRTRQDGLWQNTCFEMFVQHSGHTAYAEYNFSPSEAWAAYDFTDWRDGMAERSLSNYPVITPRKGKGTLIFDVALPLADLPDLPAALSLTAVLEEEGGAKSYWAMGHGNPDKPDFHDPSCFGAMLAAPASNDIDPHDIRH